ncbi:MAG: dethiobiotin synthase [Burkholderiaceae bacterium]
MSFFLTGTDTEVGKTVICAWLMVHYQYHYWKPIQSGMDSPDTKAIQKITGFDNSFFFPPAYELQQPLSPHESAKRDGIKIELANFLLPRQETKVIVEGAGGILVPINEKHFIVDIIKKLKLPILLVARSGLGTINHTLLTVSELKKRNLPLLGIILNGKRNQRSVPIR